MAGRIATLLGCLALVLAWPVNGQSLPSTSAQSPTTAAAPNDYGNPANWLCRPGRKGDACDVDLTTTVIAADGTMTREAWSPDPKAPIDCFYVYPTVSTDSGDFADMNAGPAERAAVAQQFARFASVCRPYAPLYRQITLARALRSVSGAPVGDGQRAFEDVRDAWKWYLAHENRGRGFVLIGHSQGSGWLIDLLSQDIEGSPVQKRLVSALLIGADVKVPQGKDVGGSFKRIPLCRKPDQVGCVVTYASYRATVPPPGNALVGRGEGPGLPAGCTNPVTSGDGSAPLHAYFSTRDIILDLSASGPVVASMVSKPGQWLSTGATIDTPFVSVPGLLTGRCTSNEHATYLEIAVHGDPNDPRTDDITGDIGPKEKPLANWGLHLVDVHLAMGDLINLVKRQARAYRSRR